MKKTLITSIIGLIVLILYILIINFYSNNPNIFDNITTTTYETSGDIVIVGVQDKVEISIIRPRIYGTILENSDSKKLYLFDIFPIPLTINGFNFIFIHLIVLIIIFFSVFIALILDLKKRRQEDEPYL